MSLTDKEILELTSLCSRMVDETITDAERVRLERWLGDSEAARCFYVRFMGQSASLCHYAAEMQTGPHEAAPVTQNHPWRSAFWASAGALLAASIAVIVWLRNEPSPTPLKTDNVLPSRGPEHVARITGAKDVLWKGAVKWSLGDYLRSGERLELISGIAQLTFDSGAQVVLQGPVSLDVNSAWDTTLRNGVVKANVPPEAIGFRISNPSVEVLDLGTEFTMVANASGDTEVLVLKGEVEAQPRDDSDRETILLREKEARLFNQSGVSSIRDRETKFARFSKALAFNRLEQPLRYVRWNFDESKNEPAVPEVLAMDVRPVDAQFKIVDGPEAGARTDGQHGNALRFDGRAYARGAFPGLSGSSAHTIAFWVRVPADAQLSDAFTMVAWATKLPKLGARPVHINWNRNPTEGPIGALRTDFGGGNAMGMTSLRDGRWHHLTICFAAGDGPNEPVQVKQYVDGKLESSTITPGKVRAPAGTEIPKMNDVVWLGCRLGVNGPRQDRFRGEIDELFIVDRTLEPTEIVSVMRNNTLPDPVSSLVQAR